MGFWSGLWHFFATGANWSGPNGILVRVGIQVELSAVVLFVAAAIGVGLGFCLGHYGRGGLLALNSANAARAVPSLALLTLLAIQPAIGLRDGGLLASGIALVALAVPPILTNAYVGMREVDAELREAARATGMSGWQRFWHVEVPLALPLATAGLRTAAVEVVATSTLAAYVTVNDLGEYIFTGLNTQDSVQVVAGAILVGVLALAADLLVLAAFRLVAPEPLRAKLPGRGARARAVAGRLVASPG